MIPEYRSSTKYSTVSSIVPDLNPKQLPPLDPKKNMCSDAKMFEVAAVPQVMDSCHVPQWQMVVHLKNGISSHRSQHHNLTNVNMKIADSHRPGVEVPGPSQPGQM